MKLQNVCPLHWSHDIPVYTGLNDIGWGGMQVKIMLEVIVLYIVTVIEDGIR